jgi:phage-related baseplate assembly protein
MPIMPVVSSSSTSVDLSRLPAPTIVEQLDYETIRAQLLAKLIELIPTFDATVESDPAVKVLEVAAYHELLLRQDFNDRVRQLLVAYATDSNLDQLATLVGVSRLLVTPGDATTGAGDVYEDDTALRQRVVLAPESFSVAGPELAYVARAKAADGAVLDASAISPVPGDVLVSVLSNVGDGTASPDLLALVTAKVTDKAVRPLGDRVTVASAGIVPFAVTAALITFSGPDVDLVLAAAATSLDSYLAANRLLGRDITLSGIYAALTVPGVERVLLTSPGADVSCDSTQAAHATAVAITHGGFAP